MCKKSAGDNLDTGMCLFPIPLKTLNRKLIYNQEEQYNKGNYPAYMLLP